MAAVHFTVGRAAVRMTQPPNEGSLMYKIIYYQLTVISRRGK